MMLHNFLGKMENAPVWDMLVKEVLGINAPKIALGRTPDERRDAFYSEFGNTVGFFGAGVGINAALNRILNTSALRKKSLAAYHWGVLGRSAALFSTGFAVIWAMPFIRNYLTAKRTGSTRFTQVIDAHAPPKNPQHPDQNLQKSLADSKRKALAIMGLGLGGTLLAIAGSRLAIAKNWGQAAVNRLFDKNWLQTLILKDGQFANFGRMPALLFWGVPAYGGWLHASRDPYERKEQLLKFVNFVACFFGPSLLLQKHFENRLKKIAGQKATLSYQSITRHLKGAAQEQALKLWATKSGAGLLSSIVLLSTMPQLINIYLTRQRLARAAHAKQAFSGQPPVNFPQPSAFSQSAFAWPTFAPASRPIPTMPNTPTSWPSAHAFPMLNSWPPIQNNGTASWFPVQ